MTNQIKPESDKPPPFLKEGERDLQDPELTRYTNNKLTQEEICS